MKLKLNKVNNYLKNNFDNFINNSYNELGFETEDQKNRLVLMGFVLNYLQTTEESYIIFEYNDIKVSYNILEMNIDEDDILYHFCTIHEIKICLKHYIRKYKIGKIIGK